jgi:hypothetical protein
VDPFNLYGIITGKGMKTVEFWKEHQPIYDGGEVKPVKETQKRSILLMPWTRKESSGSQE